MDPLVARAAEAVIASAREVYGFYRGALTVTFTQDDAVTLGRNGLAFAPGNPLSAGALIFYQSGECLPAWLCAGLELNLLDEPGLDALGYDSTLPDGKESAPDDA